MVCHSRDSELSFEITSQELIGHHKNFLHSSWGTQCSRLGFCVAANYMLLKMAFTASQGKIKGAPKPNEQAHSPGKKTKQNKTENPPFIGNQDFI